MILTFLGYTRTPQGRRPAWVAWLDARPSIGDQLPHAIRCRRCDAELPLRHLRENQALARLNMRSVSCSCGRCGTAYYFDRTPVDERDGLTWVREFTTGEE